MQTKFKVCVGVRSGPKGPVMDLSIVGLESFGAVGLWARFARIFFMFWHADFLAGSAG